MTLRKKVFLRRNMVCFRGGRCPLPFAGLGEHADRIRAGQGVEEWSAEWGLCCFTQARSGFPFYFFGGHDLYWLHHSTLTSSVFKTPYAEGHVCQRFSSDHPWAVLLGDKEVSPEKPWLWQHCCLAPSQPITPGSGLGFPLLPHISPVKRLKLC